jgi:hypothetical protein
MRLIGTFLEKKSQKTDFQYLSLIFSGIGFAAFSHVRPPFMPP